MAQLQKTLELDLNFPLAYQFLGYVYEKQNRFDEEISACKKAIEVSQDSLELRAELARALALAGQKEEAQKILNDLLKRAEKEYVVAYEIAMIYDGLGKKDEAFQWLEKAIQERSYQVSSLAVDPRLDSLRSDPRFKPLLTRLGL